MEKFPRVYKDRYLHRCLSELNPRDPVLIRGQSFPLNLADPETKRESHDIAIHK